ncbi:MAG: hypothetical protein CFH33_01486 [Alphaproteobacteria bacterium MarineAlpha9_Bin3]|nr:MAG: hypothetical protein CFH33_01486 [Alphaproteobacteria bacterium MarineAlpha9_Bin3]|tara:strand:- start:178 stop:501 length:324 start_codon:yes stop_codon:yes gene_type:complete
MYSFIKVILLLFKINIDESIRNVDTNILICCGFPNLIVITRNKIRNGKQKILYSGAKDFIDVFLEIICRKLIVIETGNNKIKVDSKLYPINKNMGVPNKSRPTPNID